MTTEINVEEQQQMVGEFLEGLAQSFGVTAKAENVAADEIGSKETLVAMTKNSGF